MPRCSLSYAASWRLSSGQPKCFFDLSSIYVIFSSWLELSSYACLFSVRRWTPLMVARSWHRTWLEEFLSTEPEGRVQVLPSPHLSLPLMSIFRIARWVKLVLFFYLLFWVTLLNDGTRPWTLRFQNCKSARTSSKECIRITDHE